jgi:MoaA/NifB/PqqE/SkfB family radical SAM enzyme
MTTPNASAYSKKVNELEYRIWRGQGPILSQLDMELTERCNNNCVHCYINLPANDAAQKREISTSEVKRVLTEAANLGVLTIRFSGGEPLLRDDFRDLYIFARRLGMRVILFTNARLITPEIADLFAKMPPLKKIEVTVYGLTEKSYEAVSRTKGSYEEFKNGVALLQDRKVPFIVKGVILGQSRLEIEQFEKWAATLPGMDKPLSYSMFFDLRCRRDSLEKNQLIKRLRVSPEEGLSIFSRDRDRYLKEMKDFCSKFMMPSGEKLFSCEAGQRICVDAYCRLQPCMPLRCPNMVYDLRNGSIKEGLAWFHLCLSEKKAINPDYLARCARCFLKGLCDQCPAKSWMEYGTLDTPVDYLCQIAHVFALDLGLLKKGEKAWEVDNFIERIRSFVESYPP